MFISRKDSGPAATNYLFRVPFLFVRSITIAMADFVSANAVDNLLTVMMNQISPPPENQG